MKQLDQKHWKLTLLGNAGVGKTEFRNRVNTPDPQSPSDYVPTAGATHAWKEMTVNGQAVRVMIYDVPSNELRHSAPFLGIHLLKSSGVLIFLDSTDTVESNRRCLQRWLEAAQHYSPAASVFAILTKPDLAAAKSTLAEMTAMIQGFQLCHFLGSCSPLQVNDTEEVIRKMSHVLSPPHELLDYISQAAMSENKLSADLAQVDPHLDHMIRARRFLQILNAYPCTLKAPLAPLYVALIEQIIDLAPTLLNQIIEEGYFPTDRETWRILNGSETINIFCENSQSFSELCRTVNRTPIHVLADDFIVMDSESTSDEQAELLTATLKQMMIDVSFSCDAESSQHFNNLRSQIQAIANIYNLPLKSGEWRGREVRENIVKFEKIILSFLRGLENVDALHAHVQTLLACKPLVSSPRRSPGSSELEKFLKGITKEIESSRLEKK